jgi:nucleotide-binding universal stress UspA family protein
VVILSADRPRSNRAADPLRLAETLTWHGVTARIQEVPTDRSGLSNALVRAALGLNCDLLVMGGYGHNRIREVVLGGVTRDILRQPAALPILMAH